MKPEKREEARRLRREGLAINEICRQVEAAKSSVSVWVRDIELTPEQQAALEKQHYASKAQINGSRAVAQKHRELRRQYQEEGRAKASEKDPLHIAGCMLYWGEGAKNRNSLKFSNSDPDMHLFYMRFLRQCLNVSDSDVKLRIMCYLGNGLSQEDIASHWLNLLKLPKSCIAQMVVNVQPVSSQQKARKLLYGTCEVTVHSTHLVNHVFGAIQEYAGIEKPEWLM